MKPDSVVRNFRTTAADGKKIQVKELTPVERDFEKMVREIRQLEKNGKGKFLKKI